MPHFSRRTGLRVIVCLACLFGVALLASGIRHFNQEKTAESEPPPPRTSDKVTVGRVTVTAVPVSETIFAFWVMTTERNEYIEFKAWSGNTEEEYPFMLDDLGNKYTAHPPKNPDDIPSMKWHIMAYPWRGKNRWSDLKPPAHIEAFAKTLPKSIAGESGTVSFHEARGDWLEFQPVAKNAKKITLLLSARNVEDEGTLRFMFDVETVRAIVKPQD